MPFQLSKWQQRRSTGCCKRRTSVPLWGRSETNEYVTLCSKMCTGIHKIWTVFQLSSFLYPSQVTCFWAPPHSCTRTAVCSCVSWVSGLTCSGTSCLCDLCQTLQTPSLTRTREEIVSRKVHHWSWCGAKHCCPWNNNKVIQHYEVPKDFMIRRWGLGKVENEWLRAKWVFYFKSQIRFFFRIKPLYSSPSPPFPSPWGF